MAITRTAIELAESLGYPHGLVAAVPSTSVEHFDGVGNPFAAAPIPVGCRVVVVGAGAGFDCFVAARLIGATGRVVGVENDAELRSLAQRVGEDVEPSVEFRQGSSAALPVTSGWADVVVANGTLATVSRAAALREIHRVLRPAGALQMVVLAAGREVDEWCRTIPDAGFGPAAVGPPTPSVCGPARTVRARSR